MKLWLALLLRFFVLGVAPADRDPLPDPEPDPQPDPDPQPELDLDSANPEPDPQDDPDDKPPTKAELDAERVARKAAETRASQFERDMAELRTRNAPAQSDAQRLHEKEEARLRDAATTDLERWQIESNRKIRATNATANQTLAQAQDFADKGDFNALQTTKPGIYARYKERVEEELAKMRRNGQNAPRLALLRFMIGNDAMDGKLQPKKKAVSDDKGVPRGKLPGARSDVQAKSGMSDREKRAKKLENVQI